MSIGHAASPLGDRLTPSGINLLVKSLGTSGAEAPTLRYCHPYVGRALLIRP